ncbi:3-deoxy-7-phosphoheptulonate synthase [Nocardiopsis valliformis]|uniref:3-deoxy-7-phosphoheptulonate synthase n=1 Tax=Nocardiopsis valliformis TaxID=239974 RepID=UPI001EF9CB3D|nr:3-deoxy-7-phosphoheptulonate synthase [Nocardiopsis valliformis]
MRTAHEALLLDYEMPLLRRTPDGRLLLSSTYWPWGGERTDDPEGAYIALLGAIANPVACKVGPSTGRDALLKLCDRIDPERRPGRLTLTVRLGAGRVIDRLPTLVEAVWGGGHPLVRMCDTVRGTWRRRTDRTPNGSPTFAASTRSPENARPVAIWGSTSAKTWTP